MIIRELIRRFRGDDSASAAVELAFIAPILASFLLVGIELTRYMIVNQKVERAAATMADLVSQTNVMTEGEISSLFNATGEIFKPFELGDHGTIIVSSIGADSTAPWIDWQRSYGDGTDGSEYGLEGEKATLPSGLLMRDGEHLIACEVYYDYEPMMLQDIITGHVLYRSAVFRPRFGSLDKIL